AEKGDFGQISRFGYLTGRLLAQLGVNFDLAPVLDLDHFPEEKNGLRGRCWGRGSQEVIDRAGLFNRWLRKQGVLGCGKHFPANGRARADTHFDLPVADCSLEDLLREDLLPYTALGPELDAVLASHVMFPQLDAEKPASLSRRVMTGLLRDQLGFEGLVLTDDLDMGAIGKTYGRGEDVRLAVEAGVDLALICHRTETVPQALEALAEVSAGRREETWRRLEKARKKLRKGPVVFSEKAWREVNEELVALTREVIGEERFVVAGEVSSPVETY
ncbi:MAG: glycoside hydrolase family 3 N-terminal domain-containing protein, partial [Verrucomicrobiales bacterium]